VLTLENIGFSRNQKQIISNIGVTVFSGCALIIKGPNGCGKTTLLKIIAGIFQGFVGNILWCQQNTAEFFTEFQSDTQIISHDNFLIKSLTVADNLHLYASLYGNIDAIDAGVAFFKLEPYLDLLPSQISAGITQKIKLAKLMICGTTIWLLDEPAVNLDYENRQVLKSLIVSHLENKGLAIITTHDNFFDSLGNVLNLQDFITA
jgi:heme exporter protein A